MLTPVDIENKEFAKTFRGYDSIEVDEFMRSLVTDYEKLYRENGSLKEKNAVLSETLENYKGMETTMQNAILVAQKTAEDIKQNAYERSATIEREAEIKAKNIISDAKQKAAELEKEYSNLKKEMNTFKARTNSLLQTYLKLLEDMPDDDDALVSDLERDINKIRKQNSENAEFKGFTDESSQNSDEKNASDNDTKTKKYVLSGSNTNSKQDASSAESTDSAAKTDAKTGSDKAETAQSDSSSETGYAPRRFNPVVDELLKRRSEGSSDDNTDSNDSANDDTNNSGNGNGDTGSGDNGNGAPEEIIIDLSNKNAKPFDVFSDDSL